MLNLKEKALGLQPMFKNGWLDDLETRAKQSIANAEKDIYSYVGGIASDPQVKQGAAATGNLSAAEIAAGARGGTAPTAAPASNSPALNNAISASGFLASAQSYAPMIIAVAALAYFLIDHKG